jgi:subtilisin family serine protease
MLELPIEEDHCYADEKKEEARDKEPPDNVENVDFEKEVLQLASEDQDTVLEINELCKKLFGIGKQVVAAAGNDWENGKARRRRRKEPVARPPLARYPAAFASVVGVGALPKDSLDPQTGKHKTSNYSNLGDRPAGDGIMTLGGEEGETNGVLGLYLSDKFPKRERINSHNDKNTITMYDRRSSADETKTEHNHWAWWSGTSFATPILTGTIAAVLSSKGPGGNYQFDSTQRVIRALYTAGVISDGDVPGAETTEAGEDVMVVTQQDSLSIPP